MGLSVLYFSWIKEKVGTGEEHVDPPSDVVTVTDLVEWLKKKSPAHAAALADLSQVRVAVDQTHVPFETPIKQDSEVAFFPPVTGG